ncbi:hypothetical protein PENTCL1PPCAC_4642, partial [Pristionchus entomophagus]
PPPLSPRLSSFLPSLYMSICPNGTLQLGYVPDYFPYIYTDENGKAAGILVEFWATMATLLGCRTVKYRTYGIQRAGNLSIFGGAVESGEVFTAVGMTWMRPNDPINYQFTTSVIWSRMLFVESSKSSLVESTSLSFYTVFPTDIFVMVIASLIAVEILSLVQNRLRGRRSEEKLLFVVLDLIRGLLFQYAFVFLLFIYQGNFKGNSLLTSDISQTSFSSMVASFLSGARKLVINSGDNYFTEAEVPIILGSYSNADWCSDMEDCFRMVCNSTSRVGLFYEPDIYSFLASSLTQNCSLVEIALPRGQSSGIGWLTRSLTDGDSYSFVISKIHPLWALKKINFALLTVYNEERMSTIHLRRSVPFEFVLSAARKQEEDFRRREFSPMTPLSLLQIAIPMEILGAGLVISLVVFAVEFIASMVSSMAVTNSAISILRTL